MSINQFDQILDEMNGILAEINSENCDWPSLMDKIMGDRDYSLTKSLCNDCDFILFREGEAFQFLKDNETGEWRLLYVGQPIYWVDREKYDFKDDKTFQSFLEELEYYLEGVEIRQGPDSFNRGSSLTEIFDLEIKEAIQNAIENTVDAVSFI